MTEIPGGDPPVCDTGGHPIVGPVIRVGLERFCKKHYQEQTVMAGRKLTIEDFPLKTEGTDRCWILGCEAGQKARGLCRGHYDKARNAGVWETLVAQIDARSEPKREILATMPLSPGDRAALETASREAGAEAELRALKEALAEAVGAHPEPLNALQQVALLQRRAARGGASALAVLKVWAAGMRADLVDIPTDPDDARAWAEQEWAKEEGYRRQRVFLDLVAGDTVVPVLPGGYIYREGGEVYVNDRDYFEEDYEEVPEPAVTTHQQRLLTEEAPVVAAEEPARLRIEIDTSAPFQDPVAMEKMLLEAEVCVKSARLEFLRWQSGLYG